MDQLINRKHKTDFLLSNDTSSIQPMQTTVKKRKSKKCNECKKIRKILESHQICRICYEAKRLIKSGNKIIDDFIKYTQTNYVYRDEGKMRFVPHDQFKDIEFIAEGGFSKIYKATWTDGPVIDYNKMRRDPNHTVVLKKLNNSKNITSKELNELKVFYNFVSNSKSTEDYYWDRYISKYYGITQDPSTQDMMIIMPYYRSGDLIHCITKDFYNIAWYTKLDVLRYIMKGLKKIHCVEIVHRDFHSGNIFFDHDLYDVRIGDLGLSKSATAESIDNDNENYGIIPYMAPEIFEGQKYIKASDIYSFGMIMWEVMTGRRPFWDRSHDADLIIEIVDGLRPPIVTNAPEGYIELMEECWHSDPRKRPTATIIFEKIRKMGNNEWNYAHKLRTKIIKSPDIGPVTINNPGAIYKSRSLSSMINSAMSLRSLRNQSIDKRKYIGNLVGDNDNNDRSIKRKKLLVNENNEYTTKEYDFDI